ncbi:MAG: RNA polymerase sigma factor [Adhaeribacter sp.]
MITSIKAGDRKAFTAFFNQYRQKLLVQVLFLTNNEELAEDITQETFARIWEKRASLEEGQTLKGYARQIARNLVFDHARKEQVRQTHLQVAGDTAEASEETMDLVMHNELAQILSEAISQLPADKQKLLHLSRFENRTYSEIAAEMQTTPKAVERHMAKSLKHIRDYLLKRAAYLIPSFLLSWLFS